MADEDEIDADEDTDEGDDDHDDDEEDIVVFFITALFYR